jgi:pimeloyl-ACP methyl ester carboxylesterase
MYQLIRQCGGIEDGTFEIAFTFGSKESSMHSTGDLKNRDCSRSHFLGTAAMGIAAAQLAVVTPAKAQSNMSFGPLKSVDAGLLRVGYAEAGPAGGPVVILLHGWPYDIHSFVDVVPLLAEHGFRVLVPYVRGCGATSFLSSATFRNGQQGVVALDVIAFLDALKIDNAVIGGFDWGGRTAGILAASWPQRCKALVSVGGYLLGSRVANKQPLPPAAEYQWWYQYYFSTERGALGYDKYRRDFGRLIWQTASPKWNFDDATFDRTAASFENPDYVAIVIHNYRCDSVWPTAKGNTTPLRPSSPRAPLSASRRSPWKATPTERRTRPQRHTAASFPGNMSTG